MSIKEALLVTNSVVECPGAEVVESLEGRRQNRLGMVSDQRSEVESGHIHLRGWVVDVVGRKRHEADGHAGVAKEGLGWLVRDREEGLARHPLQVKVVDEENQILLVGQCRLDERSNTVTLAGSETPVLSESLQRMVAEAKTVKQMLLAGRSSLGLEVAGNVTGKPVAIGHQVQEVVKNPDTRLFPLVTHSAMVKLTDCI